MGLASCASKKMQTSLQTLESENKALRGDVTKLQEQVVTLTNDLLIVQSRVTHSSAPIAAAKEPVIPSAESKPVEAPKKMYRQESFLGDDIHFTDDEPTITSSTGTMKFTNKDL